jgi:hypothetical protein
MVVSQRRPGAILWPFACAPLPLKSLSTRMTLIKRIFTDYFLDLVRGNMVVILRHKLSAEQQSSPKGETLYSPTAQALGKRPL